MPVEELRKALSSTSRPIKELAAETGIHEVNLYQFKGAIRNLPLKSLEKLAAALGLEIVVRPKKKSRK